VLTSPRRSLELGPTPTSSKEGMLPSPRVLSKVVRHTVISRDSASGIGDGSSREGPLGDCYIQHCHDSYLYLLEPFRFATMVGCTDCTVVLGAVSGMVRVLACERVTLVTACKRLYISSCVDSVFPVFTTCSPILAGDNRGCQFAPYNTAYDELEEHLLAAGLPTRSPPAVNYWNCPVDVNTMVMPTFAGASAFSSGASKLSPRARGSPSSGTSDGASFSPVTLPPSRFYTLSLPARAKAPAAADGEGEGDSADMMVVHNPFALPMEYAQALEEQDKAAEQLQMEVQAAGQGDPNKQEQLEVAIRAHFADWLVASGNFRQVLDLVQVDRAHQLDRQS